MHTHTVRRPSTCHSIIRRTPNTHPQRSRWNHLGVAVLLMVFSLAGCGGPVNSVCPVMGNPVVSDLTVDWNGRTVAFCCPPCLDEWAKMTDEERQQALDHPPVSDHAH